MQKVMDRLNYMVENYDAVKASIFKGEVSKFQLQFHEETGNPMAFGSIKCENTWQDKNGKERRSVYYANFSAFGDVAGELGLQEGDKVIMLVDVSNRKGKDGKWYQNNNVLVCEKL